MKKIFEGEKFIIHSYKHDGSIHRAWDEAVLLEEHGDYLIFGNEKTKVIESDGRTWKTKEPAVLYFYKNNWFNVIGQYKSNGIYWRPKPSNCEIRVFENKCGTNSYIGNYKLS